MTSSHQYYSKICSSPHCSFAGQPQTADNFFRNKNQPDGLQRTCKSCQKRYTAKYTTGNRDKLAKLGRDWRGRNRQHYNEWSRAYHSEHRDIINQRNKEYLDCLTPERKEHKRKVNSLWRDKNKDELKAKARERYIANAPLYRANNTKNRFRRYGVSEEWYNNTLKEQGGCAICGSMEPRCNGKRLHIDHDHRCCKQHNQACDKCRRALLCGPCNTRLGIIEDAVWVKKAYGYLAKYDRTPYLDDLAI